MARFDIMEQIIENHKLTNTYGGEVIDIDRLLTLWEMIVEENESHRHLVSEDDQQKWDELKNRTENRLRTATTPHQISHALSHVINMINGSGNHGTHAGFHGVSRENSFHARMGDD